MSNLLKEDFITINTNAWDNFFNSKSEEAAAAEDTEKSDNEEQEVETDKEATPEEPTKEEQVLPPKASTPEGWVQWGRWLKNRLEENAKSQKSESELEILDKFFDSFFNTNWGGTAGRVLVNLFKLREGKGRELFLVGGNKVNLERFNPEKFKFLKFLISNFVKEMLKQGKLSAKNFFGLLAACVAANKKVVPDAELDKQNNYNLIYCPALYECEAQALYEYLSVQAKVLSTGTLEEQRKNKRAFIYIDSVTEQDRKERASKINNELGSADIDKLDMSTAEKLNTVELAKAIIGIKETPNTENSRSASTKNSKRSNTTDTYSAFDDLADMVKDRMSADELAKLNMILNDQTAREEMLDKLRTMMKSK